MSRYSRIFHHITVDDVKRKKRENIVLEKYNAEKEKREKEELRIEFEENKSDWRIELKEEETLQEQMLTTSDVFSYTVDAEPDVNLADIDTALANSFTPNEQTFVPSTDYDPAYGPAGSATDGMFNTVLASDGSGSGDSGGFDVGSSYLQFKGGYPYGSDVEAPDSRFAALQPIDCLEMDTIIVTGIIGNGSNGGRNPTVGDYGPAESDSVALCVYYSLPGVTEDMTPLSINPGGIDAPAGYDFYNDGIIMPGNPDAGSGAQQRGGGGSLQDYVLSIPEWARSSSTQFYLLQAFIYGNKNTTTDGPNFGVTRVRYQRRTPISVAVSLDSPQASSFIRDGSPAGWKGSREKKRKELIKQLRASRRYTDNRFGKKFPGSMSIPPGSGLDVTASPLGRAAMRAQWGSVSGAPQVGKSTDGSGGLTFHTQAQTKALMKSVGGGSVTALQKRFVTPKGRNYRSLSKRYRAVTRNYGSKYWNKGASSTNRGGVKSDWNMRWRTKGGSGRWNPVGAFSPRALRTGPTQDVRSLAKRFGYNPKTTSNYKAITRRTRTLPGVRPGSAFDKWHKSTGGGKFNTQRAIGSRSPTPTRSQRAWSAVRNYGLKRSARTAATFAARRIAPKLVPGVGWASAAYDAYSVGKSAYNWSKSSQGKQARSTISKGFKSIGNTFKSWTNRSKKSTRGPNRYQRRTRSKYRSRYQRNDFELQGNTLMEFKLKKPKAFFNQVDIKPIYPEDPPPEPINGWHPDLVDGEKVSNRYNKLDPQSAKAMPKTGNPHIDRKVAKAAKKPKVKKPRVMKHLNIEDVRRKNIEPKQQQELIVEFVEPVKDVKHMDWRSDLETVLEG